MKYSISGTPIAVTFTGGLDSTTLAYDLANSKPKSMTLLLCNYKQATLKESKRLMHMHAERLREQYHFPVAAVTLPVDLPTWSNQALMTEGFIPPEEAKNHIDYAAPTKTYDYALIDGRNAFLFLHMLAFCSKFDVPVLYTGHQYEPAEWANLDSYRHRTEDFGPTFIDRMNLLQEVGFQNRVRISAPFLVTRASKHDIAQHAERLGIAWRQETYSCQFWPRCLKCDNCVNRRNLIAKMDEA